MSIHIGISWQKVTKTLLLCEYSIKVPTAPASGFIVSPIVRRRERFKVPDFLYLFIRHGKQLVLILNGGLSSTEIAEKRASHGPTEQLKPCGIIK